MERRYGLQRVEAVWKRPTCVIAPFQHARKCLGEVLPRHARLVRVIELISTISNVARQLRSAACPVAFILQGRRALGPHRLYQRSDAHDPHDAFEIVGQHMETHLGTDARQPLGQEMGRAHPGFERAEGVFDGLPA
jgi:hypothetical protein